MAKELPYYKFYILEWMMGDITLQPMNTQGVFVNVCSYYWQKDCSLALAELKQRLICCGDEIDLLIKSSIIKHDLDSDMITINFLDEQWFELSKSHVKHSKAGKKGAEAKRKQGLSEAIAGLKHIDKIRRDKIIEDKEEGFERFWISYPKKKSKGSALKSWNKIKPELKLQIKILDTLNKLKHSESWTKENGKYIPYPATWLNAMGWEDETTTSTQEPIYNGIDLN